jgi:hypothetical protein
VESHPATRTPPGAGRAVTTDEGKDRHSDNPLLRFNIIGEDQRKYGPVSGAKLLQWLAEGRVHAQTQAQLEGDTVWKALQEIAGTTDPPPIPQPPSLRPTSWRHKNR